MSVPGSKPVLDPSPAPVPAPGYPTDAIIALTYRCDARCEMCNIWQLKPQEFLSIDDYAKVPSSLRDINVSGGEAFMRSDVVDIVKVIHAKCNNPRIVVSTNGFRTTQIITAMVPLSNMFGYSTDLRSRTQGRATYSMHFEKYAEAPRNVSEEVVARVTGKVAKD